MSRLYRRLVLLCCIALCRQRVSAVAPSTKIKPELELTVTANDFRLKDFLSSHGVFGTIEPNARWTHSGTVLGCDYRAGVDVSEETESSDGLRYSVFGRIKRTLKDWQLQAQADSIDSDYRSFNGQATAEFNPSRTKFSARGNFDATQKKTPLTIHEVGMEQPFSVADGDAVILSSYNFWTRKTDLILAYGKDNTVVTIGADTEKQRLTVAQRFGKNDIAPTITSAGDIELEYHRDVGEGVWSGQLRPDNALTIKYREGPWSLKADIPIEGYYKLLEGSKVTIKRTVEVVP